MAPGAQLSLCLTEWHSTASSLWVLEFLGGWGNVVNGCGGLNCGPWEYVHLECDFICSKDLCRCDTVRTWDEIILNWGGLQISYKTGPYKTREGERYRYTEKAMWRWSQIGLCSRGLLAAPEARTETSSNSPWVLPEGSTSLITWIQISGLQNYYSINFCCFKGAFVVIYHDNLRKHIQWGLSNEIFYI